MKNTAMERLLRPILISAVLAVLEKFILLTLLYIFFNLWGKFTKNGRDSQNI